MILSPPERKIHPRFTPRVLKDRADKPVKLGIWDDDRDFYIRYLPLKTPSHLVARVLEDLARTYRPATVLYLQRRTNKIGTNPWELAVLHGDVVHQDPWKRVVLDNGRNLHTVPAERHIRTVWGATVSDFPSGARQADRDVITHDRYDVMGWTEPRHQELYYLAHNGSVRTWFAHSALRFNLGGRHWQWEEFVQIKSPWRPMNANGCAHWLLRHWDREHPEVARSLYDLDAK